MSQKREPHRLALEYVDRPMQLFFLTNLSTMNYYLLLYFNMFACDAFDPGELSTNIAFM